jgi:CheY-like chemotaxis protein
MNLLKSLSIRNKIISVLIFVLTLELVISLSAIYLLSSVQSRLGAIIDVDAEKIKIVSYVNRDLLEIHRAEKNLIMYIDKQDIDKFTGHLERHRRELDENVRRLSLIVGREERALLNEFYLHFSSFDKINRQIEAMIVSEWDEYASTLGSIMLPLDRTVNARAVALSTGDARTAYNSATDVLADLTAKTDASIIESKTQAQRYVTLAHIIMAVLSAVSIVIGLILGILMARSIAGNLNSMIQVADSIARGNLETPVDISAGDETGKLAASVKEMQASLLRARDETTARDWLKTGIAQLNDVMRGRVNVEDLCSHVISEVASYTGAQVGALFLLDLEKQDPVLTLKGGYAYSERFNSWSSFKTGEGLIGQAALEGREIIVKDIPKDYVKVVCGLGDSCPSCLSITPFLHEGQVKGVVELGFVGPVTRLKSEYLAQAMPAIAINIETARNREGLAEALAKSQTLTEELQAQQEELRTTNLMLEEQTQLLEESHERLKAQQEELEMINQELEEKNEALEQQKDAIEQANSELERTKLEIEEKAEQLEIASRYKSEFLANMSHELRTPLNSMLLLARFFAENRDGNLTDDQVRSAEIIYSSGNDLLSLINEILDLSRIEAGKMEVKLEEVKTEALAISVKMGFEHMATGKGLYLKVMVKDDCPPEIQTDKKRLEQILRNLVSNAIKFTETGGVTIDFTRPSESVPFVQNRQEMIAISVTDTGIGVPKDKQKVIFDAFQQLNGGDSRKYGGTGLGLSISRELVKLLGGEIQVESREEKGATFTIYLPVKARDAKGESMPAASVEEVQRRPVSHSGCAVPVPATETFEDDRENIAEGDKTILIIEDDVSFGSVLVGLCRTKGFKCLFSSSGEEGLKLAEKFLPRGILLDVRLPGMDGLSVLDTLKSNPKLRHIPTHMMSVLDASHTLRKGAIGYLRKPVVKEELEGAIQKLEDTFMKPIKQLLIVEDDENLRLSIESLIGSDDVQVDHASSGAEAVCALRSKKYDCMILDIGLPDTTGFTLLKDLDADEEVVVPPVIIYTGRDLSSGEERTLRGYTDSIIFKGEKSDERLLDEVSIFLHQVVERMPVKKRQIILNLHDTDAILKGKQVLIVDDDMRSAFALSRILEEKGIKTHKAENGKKALEVLENYPGIDLILMDVMMPVMDGYEAMKKVRSQERFRKLPIIALTAKAMNKDREQCLAAGANDYLAKPIEITRLISMMRVWLYK